MNRSYHFIPAHKSAYIENKNTLNADAFILDLEDSVPAKAKSVARDNIYSLHYSLQRENLFIRINGHSSSQFKEDMKLLEKIKRFNIMIPKFEGTAEEIELCLKLREYHKKIKIIALIESLKGLENIAFLLKDELLFGFALGLEDLFGELILFKEAAPDLTRHIKLNLVLKAKAYGAVCLDSISLEYKNMDKFKKLCMESMKLGFDGMMSIHPAQVAVINECFSPSLKDLHWAEKVLSLSEGLDNGYIRKDNVIITPPKIRKAKTILNYGGRFNG